MNKKIILIVPLLTLLAYLAITVFALNKREKNAETSTPSSAAPTNKSNIQFEHFRVIAPPPVAKGTAAYGTIKNTGDTAVTLTSINSPAANLMLHETIIENGMAEMNHLPSITIKAHSELVLKPMSYHLMLSKLSPPIYKKGEKILIKFHFKTLGEIKINAAVLNE